MKFKLDENIPLSVGAILQENGYNEVESVHSEGLKGINDKDLINMCKQEERILITLDNDYSNRIMFPKISYYGIILLKSRLQRRKAINEILNILIKSIDIGKIKNNVIIFDGKNVRIQ